MAKTRRALISVSDKTGVVTIATRLHELGFEILSTGGTAKTLIKHEVPVVEVSDYTGFPEMMDGRLKTLHPKIHGGLLGRRGIDDEAMAEHGIGTIDVVIVNLYPFEKTIAQPDCDLPTAVENIDIGGPTMLRAAAKNYRSVAVVVDPDDYTALADELAANDCELSEESKYSLAVKTFAHTARYDEVIANYLSSRQTHNGGIDFPRNYNVQYIKRQDLRYGENPHQNAAFYVEGKPRPGTIGHAEQVQGKELSYNNIADTDAAVECVNSFEDTACVIVKHANPCGVATGNSLLEVYDKAYATDPTSAFGGIIAFNRPLDADTATAIIDRQFVEVIAVPSVDEKASEILKTKDAVRVLVLGESSGKPNHSRDYKRVNGGLLIQDRDNGMVDLDDLKIVTAREPSNAEIRDLFFAWKVVKYVKSNAIVYARDTQTIGVGAGQMSRVYSAKIAGIKAADEGLEVKGAVMASDAFFPFRDGIDAAAAAGITAVIQPGGSMRDDEVIAAANEHNIAMVFTGMRHFRH